jgi:hypothetical protein
MNLAANYKSNNLQSQTISFQITITELNKR